MKNTHAEQIRKACLDAALQAYESAGISGLCAEGRWECAIQAMRTLDLDALTAQPPPPPHTADNASSKA